MPDHSIISSDLEIKSGGNRQLQCSSAFARRRLVLTELVSATVQPNTGDSKPSVKEILKAKNPLFGHVLRCDHKHVICPILHPVTLFFIP